MNKILYIQLAFQGGIFLVGLIVIPLLRSYFNGIRGDILEIKNNMVTEKQCNERRESQEKLSKEKTSRMEKDINGLGKRINFLNR